MADRAEASDGVDEDLLYVGDADVRTHVVYNGWPLYYFRLGSADAAASLDGHGSRSSLGTWRLVSPEGRPVPLEGQMDGESGE